MSLSRNSAEIISLSEAKIYVSAFHNQFPNSTKASFVGANHVLEILNQPDCIGIRIYNGYNNTTRLPNLVLVGVDTAEKDMTSGVIVERLVLCPAICDSSSALNV